MSDKKVFCIYAEKSVETYILADNEEEAMQAFEDENLDNDWCLDWNYNSLGIKGNDAEFFVDENGELRDIEDYVEEKDEEDLSLPGKYDIPLPF